MSESLELLTVRNVSDRTGLSESTIRTAVNKGELLAKKYKSRIRIRPADLAAWIDSMENVSN